MEGQTPDRNATLARSLARRLGASRAFVVRTEAAALLEALKERGDVKVARPLGINMPLSCVDLRACGVTAREAGYALVVDNELPTFVGCAAVRLGAHVSVEPLAPGATLVGLSKDVERALPGIGAWLEGRDEPSAETMDLIAGEVAAHETAWRAASDVAQVVASYLVCHPRVAEVRYPGLKTDPFFEVAARTLVGGFGPMVDWRRVGENAVWERTVCAPEDPRTVVMDLERRLKG